MTPTTNTADELDRRIVAALLLLPAKQRGERDPRLVVHEHGARWIRRQPFDAAATAALVATAETIEEFDSALTIAMARATEANTCAGGPGSVFTRSLEHQLIRARMRTLRAEAADIAETLRPKADQAISDLTIAVAELPAGTDALDPAEVLAADAGSAWNRANAAIAVLVTIAALAPARELGPGEENVPSDVSVIATLLPLLTIDHAGPAIHDIRGTDVTSVVDAGRAARIANVRRFSHDVRELHATSVLIECARDRWNGAVTLGYDDPTGAVALAALHSSRTSHKVTNEQIAKTRSSSASDRMRIRV